MERERFRITGRERRVVDQAYRASGDSSPLFFSLCGSELSVP